MANPVREGIHAALAAHSPLTPLVGSRIFFQKAPQTASYPLITFHKHSGVPNWTFAGPPVQNDLWVVKGIATGSGSATKAETIAEEIDAALNRAELTITGREHLFLLRDSDVDYGEEEDGEVYRHCGGLYRIYSE